MEQPSTQDAEREPDEKNQTCEVRNSIELYAKTEASKNASNEEGRNSNWGGYGYGD